MLGFSRVSRLLQAEALHRAFKIKREQLAKQSKGSVKEKYGDAGLQPSSEEARLLLGQTEGYVEYNAQGKVIKGEEAKVNLVLGTSPDIQPDYLTVTFVNIS